MSKKPPDDSGLWVLFVAVIIATMIGAVVELCRLPGRFWRGIK